MPASEHLDESQVKALQVAVAAHLPILPVLSAQLSETAAQIEQAVVEVCGNFQNIAVRTQASVSRTARFLGNQADGSGAHVDVETLIQASQGTLKSLLDRLVQASDQSMHAIDKLREVDLARGRIVKAVTAISRLAQDNRALAVNARIQAAHLGRSGSAIGVIADEVSSHARESAAVSQLMISISDELSSVLGSAMHDLEEMASIDRLSLETSRDEVERTMRDFRTTLDSMRAFIGEMVAESENLSSEIFGAVRGLQFQDRTNQRISHVTDEMHRMHAELSACVGPLPDVSVDPRVLMKDLTKRYTMSEERKVFGGVEESPTVLGDDVELF